MIGKIMIPLLILSVAVKAQNPFQWKPVIQQTTFYFSSERVTSAGIGPGIGVRATWKKNLVTQADANWLWANGNAVPVRIAIGYQKSGKWTPGLFGTFNLVFGQRTELLSKSGERPAWPVWSAGFRAAPLRFENKQGFASLFEFGYGIGPDDGFSLECTLLSVGVGW